MEVVVTRTYSYNKRVFLKRFQKARERIGCKTAKEFSAKTGIKQATISKWNTGTEPRLETVLTLCNTCGCDFDYLIGKSETFRMENEPAYRETGLSEEAIECLRRSKIEAAKAINEMIDLGFLQPGTTDETINYERHMVLQRFLSFMLTDDREKSLLHILDRIQLLAAHKRTLSTMPVLMSELCQEAYRSAANLSGLFTEDAFPGNRFKLYQTQIEMLTKKHQEELLKEYCSDRRYHEDAEKILSDLKDRKAANEILMSRIELKMIDAYSSFDNTQSDKEESLRYFITQDLMKIVTEFIEQESVKV